MGYLSGNGYFEARSYLSDAPFRKPDYRPMLAAPFCMKLRASISNRPY